MAHVPRIYRPGRIEQGPFVLEGESAKRLATVLRVRPGEEFLVFSGDGREWRAAVLASERGQVRAEVRGLERQEAPAALELETWVALVRANRFEMAIEKCTEAGATVIRPFTSDFTVRGDAPSPTRNDRWERIAIEAAEQSGRLTVPVITGAATFSHLLGQAHYPIAIGDPTGMPWPEAARLLPDSGKVAVAAGPEGGWSAAELASAKARGAILANVGPHILRTETAAIVLTSLVRASR